MRPAIYDEMVPDRQVISRQPMAPHRRLVAQRNSLPDGSCDHVLSRGGTGGVEDLERSLDAVLTREDVQRPKAGRRNILAGRPEN